MSARGPRYIAQQAGLLTYFTGKPCLRGHISERETDSGRCIECRRLTERQSYAANPEKHRQQARKFYLKNQEICVQKAREARDKETPEQRAMRLRKVKLQQRKWRKENRELHNQRNAHSKSIVRRQTPKWIGSEEQWLMREASDLARLRTKATGILWHVDHIYPLRGKLVCGLHVPENLQVITQAANARKHNRYAPA